MLNIGKSNHEWHYFFTQNGKLYSLHCQLTRKFPSVMVTKEMRDCSLVEKTELEVDLIGSLVPGSTR
ncbi:protein-lysine N-methyltransferase EFM1 isoform X2 [Gossypium australe]|uniref:Protein-lysine N-methyltransferase EFM1 isoform X2 n=1 Tax=Gossypium australe TaxID=47621 RepID=A0A5B6UQQ0_9ROSI|nr:protein-lysine N-methyltransferase EFM1 isoform X2 [Gossypium australe]